MAARERKRDGDGCVFLQVNALTMWPIGVFSVFNQYLVFRFSNPLYKDSIVYMVNDYKFYRCFKITSNHDGVYEIAFFR